MHKALACQPCRTSARLLLGALVLMLSACAHQSGASAHHEAQAQRLGDLFEQALPIKHVVRSLLQAEPKWPFRHASNISPAELACVRAEMHAGAVIIQQREDARRYAKEHPQSLAQDIQLLESGAASALGFLMMAGIGKETSKQAPTAPKHNASAHEVMKTFSLEQTQAMMQLMFDPGHEDLRKAMRINFIPDTMLDRSSARKQGAQIGARLILPSLLSAMQKCKISPAALH